MSVNTGAGAAVSSGAGYQARVASYVLATAICKIESILPQSSAAQMLGFETAESIDDLNIRLTNGGRTYIQAKANIAFSLSGELRSVFQQFEAQDARQSNDGDAFLLATSSRSSKKVTYELRAALEAFRTAPEQDFFRDQPKSLTEIILELRQVIRELQELAGRARNSEIADRILRKSHVVVLDIESGDSLENAIVLMLQANGFLPPSAVWGKLIADCIEHAKARHTVQLTDVMAQYERYRSPEIGSAPAAVDDLIKVELGATEFSVAKEIVLCRVPEDTPPFSKGLAVMEFFRFDDSCNERIRFTEDTVILSSGLSLPLYRRSATAAGLTRFLESNTDLFEDEDITVYEADFPPELEASPCAQIHRAKLRQAVQANRRTSQCFHCGRSVSEAESCLVEFGSLSEPMVGACHTKCLLPGDRLIGKASMDFFREYPELVHFDANAWFRASHGGQMALGNADLITNGTKFLLWNGDRLDWPDGQFVVEISLQGGGSEIMTHRNGVHRFTKSEAEEVVAITNRSIEAAHAESDPWCYTDQSKGFGLRSFLLEQLGGKERILPVGTAKIRKYEERFAARYYRPGHWYAPLLYLRDLATGEPFERANTVPIVSNPLNLKNFLANWQEAGLDVPDYETASLLTDADFDRFMKSIEARGWHAVIDPIMDPSNGNLISGMPIGSADTLKTLTAKD